MLPVTDIEPWEAYAPEAFAAFARAERLVAGAVDPALLAPVREVVARLLCNSSGDAASDAAPDPRAPACVAFAEQFVVDVAGVTPAQRAALSAALGDATFPFVQALYVEDVFQRGRLALGRLHHRDLPADRRPEEGDLWPALEDFMRLVALQTALDPLTTELVRLRGANAHRCRLCQSRLSVRALDAAGDRSPFAAVDDYEHSSLSERHKVALRLTDAVITQPALIDDALVAQVRANFSMAESSEIVLDVVRNAANKIAVAFGADAPQVTDGTEYFDIDATGELVAALDAEVVRVATAG